MDRRGKGQGIKADLGVNEKLILEYWAKGYHPKEIAPLLKISRPTVNYYGRLIRAKLHARTTAQAVAIGVANNLIRIHNLPYFEE